SRTIPSTRKISPGVNSTMAGSGISGASDGSGAGWAGGVGVAGGTGAGVSGGALEGGSALGGDDGPDGTDGVADGPAAAGLQAAIARTASSEAVRMSFDMSLIPRLR